jgi:NitT/TauT family transport system ATP-binding protein
MTNIPTRVAAVIDVDIPNPRRLSNIFELDQANAIKMKALKILHEEAMKSFRSGSKAAADFIDAYSKRVSS